MNEDNLVLKIIQADNGYILSTGSTTEVVSDDGDEVDDFATVLRKIDNLCGPSTSKYSPKRIHVIVEPGENYEDSSVEKVSYIDEDMIYVPEGKDIKNDGLECFLDKEGVLEKLKDVIFYKEVSDFAPSNLINPDEDNVSSIIDIPKLTAAIIYKNFTPWRKEKAERAVKLMLLAANSDEFKDRVLNHKYNGYRQFASCELSNKQVYDRIMRGSETLNPDSTYVMNLEITTYYSWKNVIGYTYPNINGIFVNTRYFDNFYLSSIAGNFFHEWTHKLGFDHDFNSTRRRPYSVPYAVGNIIGNIVSKM